jgi:hypothetical protein
MALKVGSIIQRETHTASLAVHTGIYVGNGRVIHFDGESSSSNNTDKVIEVSIEEFADGKDVYIRKEPMDEEHGKKIAQRAREIMNDENNEYNGNYGLIFGKNCQDFTADCYNNA